MHTRAVAVAQVARSTHWMIRLRLFGVLPCALPCPAVACFTDKFVEPLNIHLSCRQEHSCDRCHLKQSPQVCGLVWPLWATRPSLGGAAGAAVSVSVAACRSPSIPAALIAEALGMASFLTCSGFLSLQLLPHIRPKCTAMYTFSTISSCRFNCAS